MDDLMMNLFGICDMYGTYEERKVSNTKRDAFELDTARVTDRPWIYETAVAHKEFRNGDWIVLEGCSSKEEAERMHEKWLGLLDRDDYNILTDCYEKWDYHRN